MGFFRKLFGDKEEPKREDKIEHVNVVLNEPKVTKDPISNELKIDWEQVAGLKNTISNDMQDLGILTKIVDGITMGGANDNFSKIVISPIYQDGRSFMKLKIQWRHFQARKGASFTFKFENDELIQFILQSNPVKVMTDDNWGRIDEIKIPISGSELKLFATSNMVFWRYKKGENIIDFKEGIAEEAFRPLGNLQSCIRSLFTDFIELLNEKGLSIDNEVDKGELISRKEIEIFPDDTLASTYKRVRFMMEDMFISLWPSIKNGTVQTIKLDHAMGSYHSKKELETVQNLLTEGWSTKISSIISSAPKR